MSIDFSEIGDDEKWELFARDFLSQVGFLIEIGPGRGADAGKDLIVSEPLKGTFFSRHFRQLVSCKYPSKSVGLDDEPSRRREKWIFDAGDAAAVLHSGSS